MPARAPVSRGAVIFQTPARSTYMMAGSDKQAAPRRSTLSGLDPDTDHVSITSRLLGLTAVQLVWKTRSWTIYAYMDCMLSYNSMGRWSKCSRSRTAASAIRVK